MRAENVENESENEFRSGGFTGWQKAKAQKMNMNPEESQVSRKRMRKKLNLNSEDSQPG